jgi:type IV pilus assembly protein PilC
MEFTYVATTRSGKITRGSLEAASRAAATTQIRKKDLLLISLEERKGKFDLTSAAMGRRLGWGRVSLLDRVIFARHMALMLRSGLALNEALSVMAEQSDSAKMRNIVGTIEKAISNGESLSGALKKYPRVFSGIFVGMVEVGEASGSLERNLEYVATALEKDYALRRKVIAAMIYPIIILIATFLVGIAMTFFVLPRIVRMFETLRITLPTPTRLFIGLAKFLVADGIYVLIGIVILAVLLRILVRAKPTRPFFHRLILNTPFLRNIIRKVNLARITRILAVLLKCGVTINESLAITARAIDNVVYRKILLKAAEEVKTGKSLAVAFAEESFVSKMTSRMISVGEKTGKLEENLFYLADFYEGEVDQSTKNLSSVIGPVLMIVIGVVLGLLAIAIISPIYQFSGSLGR